MKVAGRVPMVGVLDARRTPHVRALARDLAAAAGGAFGGSVRRVDEPGALTGVGEGVVVMDVRASKGLEFDAAIVVLGAADLDPADDGEAATVHRNQVYVALTRGRSWVSLIAAKRSPFVKDLLATGRLTAT